LTDAVSIRRLVDMKFDMIFNLAAQSFVQASFSEPYYTFQTNAVGVLTFLEEIRQGSPNTKYYQSSTSEIFGGMILRFDGRELDASYRSRLEEIRRYLVA
jgi:GDPmannose 4,6-dehydratase